MKEGPILYKSEMVNAVLEDRKWKTRRVIKPQPDIGDQSDQTLKEAWANGFIDIKCPYGAVGDQLWVKENYVLHQRYDSLKPSVCPEVKYLQQGVSYCADIHNMDKSTWMGKTRPSIFMRRDFSRIQLEIISVGVERLQDISEDDAIAEGIRLVERNQYGQDFYGVNTNDHDLKAPNAHTSFMLLWDSINGKPRKDGTDISWYANPWVWVVEFKKI